MRLTNENENLRNRILELESEKAASVAAALESPPTAPLTAQQRRTRTDRREEVVGNGRVKTSTWKCNARHRN
jgi:hypothetical protein